jgi:ABC-type nitrate/sulfonate/bicarbonate transport system substrate-binding protein
VDQLRYLISQLELEDNKVKILELAQPRIYDYDRAALIVDDFFLERNKNKVKELLQ